MLRPAAGCNVSVGRPFQTVPSCAVAHVLMPLAAVGIAGFEHECWGGPAMPLRDHFRSPLDDEASWEEFHGQWPAMIVIDLARRLPPGYVAAPRVHLGAMVEIDVATFEKDFPGAPVGSQDSNGGVATAVWRRRVRRSQSRPTCRPRTSTRSGSTIGAAGGVWWRPSKSSARRTRIG